MSLEYKVKSRRDIVRAFVTEGYKGESDLLILFNDAVKHEDQAIKEVADAIHEDWNRAGREWHKEENELKAKIAEANKLLADLDQLWTYKMPGNCTEMDHLILQLKLALNGNSLSSKEAHQ